MSPRRQPNNLTSSRPGSDPLAWILFSLLLIATLAIFALAELVLHVVVPTNQPYADSLLADNYADYRPWSAQAAAFALSREVVAARAQDRLELTGLLVPATPSAPMTHAPAAAGSLSPAMDAGPAFSTSQPGAPGGSLAATATPARSPAASSSTTSPTAGIERTTPVALATRSLVDAAAPAASSTVQLASQPTRSTRPEPSTTTLPAAGSGAPLQTGAPLPPAASTPLPSPTAAVSAPRPPATLPSPTLPPTPTAVPPTLPPATLPPATVPAPTAALPQPTELLPPVPTLLP